MQCENFDGGFGLAPGCESHAGQIFCCVAALAIAGRSMVRQSVSALVMTCLGPILISETNAFK